MSDTSTPSSRILPEVGCSKPAISRKVVVLPQPEGPSREKNSPLATVRSTLSTAISPNLLVSPDSSIAPPPTAPPPHATCRVCAPASVRAPSRLCQPRGTPPQPPQPPPPRRQPPPQPLPPPPPPPRALP